ncbi:MAG: hypothetical protein WCV62_01895 [Candidatus Peribacteraceae bacterium]|jgi:hypothetical protein
MFGKLFDLLVSVAVNGLIALFLSGMICIVLALVLMFASIPIGIIANTDPTAFLQSLMDTWMFRIVYVIVFANLMMDTYNVPNLKGLVWKKRHKTEQAS